MLKANEHFVSPLIRRADLPQPLTIEAKIDVFEDRVMGWQLVIADQLYFGPRDKAGTRLEPQIAHNGFAVLYILLSYFEMISKYEDGNLSEVSGVWFKTGILRVFPELVGHADETDTLVAMWKGARNGLYHSAMTKQQVFVSGDARCMDYDAANKRLVVNPGEMVRRTINHFLGYTKKLRDPANAGLRDNFQKKFDAEILPQFA